VSATEYSSSGTAVTGVSSVLNNAKRHFSIYFYCMMGSERFKKLLYFMSTAGESAIRFVPEEAPPAATSICM
jgi:hypothetical protein